MSIVLDVRRFCLFLIVTVSCSLAVAMLADSASATPVRGATAGHSPAVPAAASASASVAESVSAHCVFGGGNPVDCESEDPQVTKVLYSGSGDCSSTYQAISINWGDKTPVEKIKTYGPTPEEKLPIGSHD